MEKGSKVQKNLLFGILAQILTIALGIVLPRLTLTSYGSEVNGLVSSVTNIYTYVALLEAGVGGATLQALYKSIGNGNNDETNSILAATNKYYKRTGFAYLIAIFLFSIVYPIVVKTSIPIYTIVLVIIFNGLGNVIRFLFQGKYFLLLQAEGKNYIQTMLGMFITVFTDVMKIILMSNGFDVVFVQSISVVCNIFSMLFITIYIKKYYSWIDVSVKPDFSKISQSKNVLIHQINQLVFNNTDTIILTLFVGLKTVSVYSMYTLLFGMVQTALGTVINSVLFVLGQAYHSNRERFLQLYDCYELYYMTIAFWLYSVANFFILPFISLYTSGVNDISYVDRYLPLMFVSTFLMSTSRNASSQAINIAGHFKQTQNRAFVEAGINLIVSIISVHFLGIYGVLLGTIVALVYRANDMILYTNHKILMRSAWPSYRRWLVNAAVFVLILYINRFISLKLDNYIMIVCWCIPYTICSFILFFATASISDPKTAKIALDIIKGKISIKRGTIHGH